MDRDKFGNRVDVNSHSWNINDLILNEGICDPQEITKILLERALKAKLKMGSWTRNAETEFDKMMNRVLSHIKFIRDEKKGTSTVRSRMANAGFSQEDIDERIKWAVSVLPEPKEYARGFK